MTVQTALWTVAAGGAALTGVSALADWRRSRRRNLDRPGWVPWTGLQIISILVAFIAAGLALNA